MINKRFIKQYVKNQEVLPKIDMVLSISEERSKNILASNDWYKDLYINPDVDIVNSHPQVTQQVREELVDFLELLQENGTKTMLDWSWALGFNSFYFKPVVRSYDHD